MESRPIYILDTNVIIDYPNIIPNGEVFIPEEPTIDLSSAHIIIPTAVIRELSNFKTEMSDRGRIAREVLKKIRQIGKDHLALIEKNYSLQNPIPIHNSKQVFSILPINQNFTKSLPFYPSDSDMDGQIIVTALAAIFSELGFPVDGTADYKKVETTKSQVVILTNDNGLAARAAVRGIKSERFGYKQPPLYTGRRNVTISMDLFNEFWNTGKIEMENWVKLLPNEPKLIANEFIIMETDCLPRDYDYSIFNNIGRYDAETNAIVKLKYAYNFPVRPQTVGQAIFAEALMNPDIPVVICTGPAGTGKTFLSAIYALNAVKNGEYLGISVVPCGHEKDTLGFLPGDIQEKLGPYVQPIKNAIRNHLLKTDNRFVKAMKNLKKFGQDNKNGLTPKNTSLEDDNPVKKSLKESLENQVELDYQNWFGEPIPIDFARGRDFSHEIAIYDEFQDQNFRQADTLIKRLGEDGKIIITGDIEQIHAAYLDRENNGIVYASKILKDSPMVARISLTEEEVVRHPLVKMITQRQKSSPCT